MTSSWDKETWLNYFKDFFHNSYQDILYWLSGKFSYVYTHTTTLFSLISSHLTLQTAVNPYKLKFRLKPIETHLINIFPKLLNTKHIESS